MAEEVEQAQADIVRSRAELAATADDIHDRLSPRRMASRQGQRVKGRVDTVRRSVMGVPGQATGHLTESAGAGTDQLRQLPDAARQGAQGNPLAAGLIAFGLGFLLASLGPPTDTERQAVSSIAAGLDPVREHLQEAAGDLASGMTESAQEAAHQVQDAGTQAAQQLAAQGRDAAKGLADDGRSAVQQ